MADNLEAKAPSDVEVWVGVLTATVRMIPQQLRGEVLREVFDRLSGMPRGELN